VELPKVLQFHLERFSGASGIKIKSRFTFPFELEMRPFCDESVEETKYELVSVIAHQGEHFAGHYICYCRPSVEHDWFRFDDTFVQKVSRRIVVEDGYGGPISRFCGYFLTYVKKSEIYEILKPVENDEIRPETTAFYAQWYEEHKERPDCVALRVFTVQSYLERWDLKATEPSFTIPVAGELKFEEIRAKISEKAGFASCLIWQLDKYGLPLRKLDMQTTVKNCAKVFVTDGLNKSDIPLFVGFFDPNLEQPLRLLSFEILDQTSNWSSLESLVRQRCELIREANLIAFLYDGKSRRIDVNRPVGLVHGAVIFQLSSCPILRTFPRSIDLIPDLLADRTVAQYLEFMESAQTVVAANRRTGELHEFQISMKSGIPDLITCISVLARVSESESVMLFGGSDPKPLNFPDDTPLSMIIPHGRVFYEVLESVTQEEIRNSFLLKCDVAMSEDDVEAVEILVPRDATIGILKERLQLRGRENWRVLQLNGSLIVKELADEAVIQPYSHLKLRVEMIPEEHKGANPQNLILVAWSKSRAAPRSQAFGYPFLFLAIENEVFGETKKRLLEQIGTDCVEFGFATEAAFSSLKILQDADVVSKLMQHHNSMIYIFPRD
jgi:hypothetical protein